MKGEWEMEKDLPILEGLVDKHGLSAVIDALIDICHGKAEHLESNWQDTHAAKEWTKAAKKLDRVTVLLP